MNFCLKRLQKFVVMNYLIAGNAKYIGWLGLWRNS